jgi:hypothetical protein
LIGAIHFFRSLWPPFKKIEATMMFSILVWGVYERPIQLCIVLLTLTSISETPDWTERFKQPHTSFIRYLHLVHPTSFQTILSIKDSRLVTHEIWRHRFRRVCDVAAGHV